MHDDDVYIQILKWAKKKGNFTQEEIFTEFPNHKGLIQKELGHSKIFNNFEGKYFLSFDDRFKLLEYDELQEARRSSKIAFRVAIASIILSIIVLGLTAYSVFYHTQYVEITQIDRELQNTFLSKLDELEDTFSNSLKTFQYEFLLCNLEQETINVTNPRTCVLLNITLPQDLEAKTS